MAAETGFLIDGTVYEVPTLSSLTMDEEQVMYERCELGQEDFVQLADETDEEYDERTGKLMGRPGFWAALMHIAYQRGNPTVKPGQVKLVVGNTNRREALSALGASEEPEGDEVPLALTSEPLEPSSSSSLTNDDSTEESNGTSGNGSTNGSEDAPAVLPRSIGTSRSGTSSISGRSTSAAVGRGT